MRQFFDVLVAGGGPAGSAAALDLARRGFSVALIEQDGYQSPRVGETLPPFIRQQLTGLGVWQRFLETGPLESFGIQSAWDTAEAREQEFMLNPYGCGWHVDRARFDGMLAASAADAGAEWITARVGACYQDPDGQWRLEAPQEGIMLRLSGRILVDATGRKALLASRLGAQAQVADRLIGAVSFAQASEPEQRTLIEAVRNGWWYSAPLPGRRMVFAYMTDADMWQETEWARLLQSAPLTAQRAGRVELPWPSEVVSAASVVREPVTGPGWIAIGDAALAYDPLSGQGVLKSIDTGLRAAAAMARVFAGDATGLAEYEDWVKATYATYLSVRTRFYSGVQRWPHSEFWKRRAGA